MRTIVRLWREEKELVVAGIATILAGVLSFILLARNDWLTNVGFLVFGALIAILTTLLSERLRRKTQVRDLARSLHVELADRVARCCFDTEAPWGQWASIQRAAVADVNNFRLRKFVPDDPIIYQATASQLALLGREVPQALVKFYYRLSAWRRDLENVANSTPGNSDVEMGALNLLAIRLRQTLKPGLRALEAMEPFVEGFAEVEASALAGYDEYRPDSIPIGTLRDRLSALIG